MPLGKRKASWVSGCNQRPEKLCRLIEKKDKAEKLLRETLGDASAADVTKGDVYRDAEKPSLTSWQHLPSECKAKILASLNIFEKGKYAVTCREWKELIYSAGNWPNIQLGDFSICRGIVSSYFGNTSGSHTPRSCHHTSCQTVAHRRMAHYLEFLTNRIQPCPKNIAFDLDIYSWNFATGVRWADYLTAFFEAISCNSLRRLTLKWKGTLQSWTYRSADQRDSSQSAEQQQQQELGGALPAPPPPGPPQIAIPGMAPIYQQGPQSRDYERNLLVNVENGFHVGVGDGFEGTARRRVDCFHRLFQLITSKACNMQSLELPFDWSDKSVPCLSRLTRLKSLFLETGLFLKSLPQDSLDQVLSSLGNLKALHLSERCPVQWGYHVYDITSASLELLNISQSNGLFLRSVDTPRLTTLLIQRHSWAGPAALQRAQAVIPCLHKVLRNGAPRLKNINEFVLESPPWASTTLSPESKKVKDDGKKSPGLDLDVLFRKLCSCAYHKGHWAL